MYIWFNLLLFSSGHWVYIDSYETLEECQQQRTEYETEFPGNYFCLPHQVFKAQNEFYARSES